MRALCLDDKNDEDDEDNEADLMQKEIATWHTRLQNIQGALCSVENKL
jgi:hypothetical protein